MRILALASAFCLCAAPITNAIELRAPERIESIVVAVTGAPNDCLPNLAATRKAAELVFRTSGIAVTELSELEAGGDHIMWVSPIAMEHDSLSCVVAVSMLVVRAEEFPQRSSRDLIMYGRNRVLFVGGKDTMQARITEAVRDYATELANDVLRARAP